MSAKKARSVARLKKRAGFLNAAKGVYLPRSAFSLQRNAQLGSAQPPRLGFTVTKKVGNAVVRNRVRRRLKEAAAAMDQRLFEHHFDYVVIGRNEALAIPFKTLCTDMETGLKKLARGEGRPSRSRKAGSSQAKKP